MTDEEAKAKNDTVIETIEREWGPEAPYVLIVHDEGDVRVSSNLGTDDLVQLLVACAEHAGILGVRDA